MMKRADWVKTALIIGVAGGSLGLAGCGEKPIVPPPPVPAEYADKHMPEGWWGDKEKLEEGRKIYIGQTNPDVNCASCHGKRGKPVKAGARDFRRTEQMKLYSDSAWFWRVNEGVPNTKMKAWKSKLSEEDIWKVMLYERTFALEGLEYDPSQKKWVKIGTAGAPRKAEAPAGGEAPEAGAGAEAGKEAGMGDEEAGSGGETGTGDEAGGDAMGGSAGSETKE